MHEQIKKAREFSLKAHNTQVYGDIYPYFKHLEDVYNILIKFGFTEEHDLDILTAAFLHDTIEDTQVSFSDLKRAFDENIAEIVYCMSDELGRTRKEKKEKTYPKIRSNPKSVILKVADRIANVEFSRTQDSGHIKMYRSEFKDFEYHLRIYRQIDSMWEHLNRSLFSE
jgi:(p)ppGpp synthase/HD superfamily hydrolase